jgi:pimeloyl-ACP methyl ester carboxylesterase
LGRSVERAGSGHYARRVAYSTFTPSHRAGSGPPLVLLHGFLDTWRTWEPVLPALERGHEVLALTLAGHAGGPPINGEVTPMALADAVERTLDAAGLDSVHVAGSSLGGHVALQLATRERADSVVALAPAGGWTATDDSYTELLRLQRTLYRQTKVAAANADSLLATREGRRRATQLVTQHFEHLPVELLAHELLGIAACPAAERMLDDAERADWRLEAQSLVCPVRVLWGTADHLLPWPAAAARYRSEWLPNADWVVLDGVGHYPHWDVPIETAQLILGFTSP